jgi:hypothetical protein
MVNASRVLLLAVAMGFGVVFPSLPRRPALGGSGRGQDDDSEYGRLGMQGK